MRCGMLPAAGSTSQSAPDTRQATEIGGGPTLVQVLSSEGAEPTTGRRGYGLIGLAERVEQIGGRLDSGPRRGPTRIRRHRVLAGPAGGNNVMTIRVLLVDDHDLLRTGLATVLATDPALEVVGECGDGVTAVRLAAELLPDLVLMDIEMPGGNGITATAAIVQRNPTTRVMILTTFDLDDYVLEALRAGASGFLLKTTPPRELTAAVKACAAGETTLGPTVIRRLVDTYVTHEVDAPLTQALTSLTKRETEVLKVMARGKSNHEIGAELYLAETTVKTHVARILAKLGVRDRVQAVVIAHDSGLLRH